MAANDSWEDTLKFENQEIFFFFLKKETKTDRAPLTNYSTYSTLVFFYLSCDWPLGCLIDRLHLCGLARQLQHKVHCCHATVGSSITKYSRPNWVSLRRPLSVYFQTFCSVVTQIRTRLELPAPLQSPNTARCPDLSAPPSSSVRSKPQLQTTQPMRYDLLEFKFSHILQKLLDSKK